VHGKFYGLRSERLALVVWLAKPRIGGALQLDVLGADDFTGLVTDVDLAMSTAKAAMCHQAPDDAGRAGGFPASPSS
jgi:hypothetical protein